MKSNSTGKILPDGTMILSLWNETSADKLIELQVLDKDDLYVFELSLDQVNSFKQTDILQSEYLDSIFYALVPYSNESKPQQVVSCAINRKKESVEFKVLSESKLKIVFFSIPLQSGTLNRDIAATDPKRIQFMNTIINKVQQDLSMTVGSSQELKLIEDEVQQRRAFEFELMSKCMLLINAKKQKIRELEDELRQLKEQSSQSDDDNNNHRQKRQRQSSESLSSEA